MAFSLGELGSLSSGLMVPAVDDDLLAELDLRLYLELGHIVGLFAGALLKAMAVGRGKYFGSKISHCFCDVQSRCWSVGSKG
jgi:hypothetical protein